MINKDKVKSLLELLRMNNSLVEKFSEQKDFNSIINYALEAVEIYNKILERLNKFNLLNNDALDALYSSEKTDKDVNVPPDCKELLLIRNIRTRLIASYKQLARDAFNVQDYAKCVELLKNVISITIKDVETYSLLGKAFLKWDILEEAEQCYSKVIELDPSNKEAAFDLGGIYYNSKLKDYKKALVVYENYLKYDFNCVPVLQVLAKIYANLGQQEKSIMYAMKAIKTDPGSLNALFDFAWNQIKIANRSQKQIKESLEEVVNGYIKHQNIQKNKYSFENIDKNKDKKLHIGYFGSDFKLHVVSYFTEKFISLHDKEKFKISCYYTGEKMDAVSERFKNNVDNFVHCHHLSIEEIANKINEDKVDILIDLTGVTGNIKMFAIAYKPAPIQCCYMGFPTTYGLDTVDYILTDRDTVEPQEEDLYTEKIAYIEHGYEVCDIPKDHLGGERIESPCFKNRFVTFGVFNNPHKLTNEALDAYAKILSRVSKSKIVFHSYNNYNDLVQNRVISIFEQNNIEKDRVLFKNNPSGNHLEHNKIMLDTDIALDTFPYNGVTTTIWSVALGLPVVAIYGYNTMSRAASRILKQIGLPELVAKDLDDFINIAVNLANDCDRIAYYRENIEQKYQNSRFFDYEGFTRSIENTYRRIWTDYCNKEQN